MTDTLSDKQVIGQLSASWVCCLDNRRLDAPTTDTWPLTRSAPRGPGWPDRRVVRFGSDAGYGESVWDHRALHHGHDTRDDVGRSSFCAGSFNRYRALGRVSSPRLPGHLGSPGENMTKLVIFFVLPLVVLALSIPLILGKVPPNNAYGFRTQKTLRLRRSGIRPTACQGGSCLPLGSSQSASTWLCGGPFRNGRWRG